MKNWKKIEAQNIKERRIGANIYEHSVTKAKLIHLANDDVNKAFAVTFKTIPEDSTGVAHILEHTVLTGSKKYPVRDPFFSMLKRSLQSFMNAFTSEDWTAYPFASPNTQDFFNLLDIYLDASFFPLLKEENFLQEGHRLDFENGRLVRKGVVYNEMKGSMSSSERIMAEGIKSNLFPITTYHYNSGGDPSMIPKLSYQELQAFHERFYHPSNAFFFLYGKIDIETVLDRIDTEVMEKFALLDPQTEVPLEPKWTNPKKARIKYPYTGDDYENKYQYNSTWLLGGVEDVSETLGLEILDELLLGHPGTKLRVSLTASGLGSDLADGSGLNQEARSLWFSVGLKDTQKGSREKIDKIIQKVLQDISKNGFAGDEVAAAIRKKEFSIREFTNTPYPYGLQLWLEIITPWLHGADPIKLLSFEDLFQELRRKIDAGFLESLIKKYLIDNKHRLDLSLEPDLDLATKREKEELLELRARQDKLSNKEVELIKKQAQELEIIQTENEDLSCLPRLSLGDIDKKVRTVDFSKQDNVLSITQNTNGLFYFGFSIDLFQVKSEDQALLPFLTYVLTKAGTKNFNNQELSQEIQKKSSGMTAGVFAKTNIKTDKALALLTLSAKSLPQQVSPALELAQEILNNYSFNDKKVLSNLLNEYIARFEQDIVEQGHFYAMSLAAQNLNESLNLSEKWIGIRQLKYLKKIKSIDLDLPTALNALASSIFSSKALVALIGENAEIELAKKKIDKEAINNLGSIKVEFENKCNVAFRTDTDVSFCAEAIKVVKIGHIDAAVLLVMSKLLGRGFLHNEIREKGGAYGGFARFDLSEGVWYFASYRDPHIVKTFDVFDRAREYAQKNEFTKEEIEDAIIMCIGEMEKPDAPIESARKAFARFIVDLDDKIRQEFKDKLLRIQSADIKRVARKYLRKENIGHKAVISNQGKIVKANKEMKEKFIVKKI